MRKRWHEIVCVGARKRTRWHAWHGGIIQAYVYTVYGTDVYTKGIQTGDQPYETKTMRKKNQRAKMVYAVFWAKEIL